MRQVLAVAALLISVAPATACINAGNLANEEQEFRSQYNSKPVPSKPVESPSTRNGLLIGLSVVGLVGAVAVTLTTGRSRV
jgi:hypothetical protein